MITKEYCCEKFNKFSGVFEGNRYNDAIPIVINKDLSLSELGAHEVWNVDEPMNLYLKYCPFCGNKIKV